MPYNSDKEIREAINAGERALRSLKQAQDYLNSAGNWGIVDMIGGGLITTFIKHSKIDDAKYAMESAKRDLVTFSRELGDVNAQLPGIDMGDFLSFADYFFDGIIADVIVQSKISDAKRQVATAISRVEQILRQLRNL